MVTEMYGREMSQQGNVQSGKSLSAKCPVEEMSVRGNVHRGSVLRGSVSWGSVQSGNCLYTIENVFKTSCKIFSKRLQDVFVRRLQDVLKTNKCLLGIVSSEKQLFQKFQDSGIVALQFTGCNATKQGLLTTFLKRDFKILGNFQEEFCNGVCFQ